VGTESGSNNMTVKRYNRALLLRLILENGPISRMALSRRTQLSRAAVTTLTSELIEHGLIREMPTATSQDRQGVGRPPIGLCIEPDSGMVIGIDINRQSIRTALINLKAEIVWEENRTIVKAEDVATVANDTRESIEAVRTQAATMGRPVYGLGLSLPGVVDKATSQLEYSSSMGWGRVCLSKTFGCPDLPFTVDRNVRAMACAERMFGVGRDCDNMVLVYVGNGIGCGLIVNGESYSGNRNWAGEIGHTIVCNESPKLCTCGNYGCLETVASGHAIAAIAKERIRQEASSMTSQLIGQDTTRLTGEAVFAAAEAGDELARDVINTAGHYLGSAVLSLYNILDPQLIILAGTIEKGGSEFLEHVNSILAQGTPHPISHPQIRFSQFGEQIGLVGAGTLALKEFIYSSNSPWPNEL
jgi:N-acetylglucosamine repressor